MGHGSRTAGVALGAAALAIALASVLVREALDRGATTEAVTVARLLVAALAIGCVVAWGRILRGGVGPHPQREVRLAALYGLTLAGVTTFEVLALDRLAVASVVLLFALVPAWVALFSWMLWRRPLSRGQWAAIALALGGTALVVGFSAEPVDPAGVGFALAAGLTATTGFLLLERGIRTMRPDLIILIGASAAAVAALAVALALPGDSGGLTSIEGEDAMLVVGIGGLAGVNLVLGAIGIRRSSAFAAGVALALEPIFAGVLAWLILGEGLTAPQLAGGALAIAGLAVSLGEEGAVAGGEGASSGP